MLATVHYCPTGRTEMGTYRCPARSVGAPKRKTCPGCGGPLRTERGRWAVFPFDPTGQYPTEQARKLFARKAAADAYADKATEAHRHERGYVVRWIPQEEL